MCDNRWPTLFALPLMLVVAAAAHSQERLPDDIRQGGGVIILDGGRLVIEGNISGTQTELLPTPQQLRAVIISPAVRELVEQLDVSKFAEREAATRRLIDLRIEDEQLFAVLERGELSAEQHHRLLYVVRECLINTPRGALGIRMDAGQWVLPRDVQVNEPRGEDEAAPPPPGVTILEVIAGMPAERVLRVGDRITHISESPLVSSDDLIDLVQTRRPGDIINMTVQRPRRDGEGRFVTDDDGRSVYDRLELEITLGSVDGLHDPRVPAPPSRLELQRRRMVAAIEQRYGNKVRTIEVKQP